MATKTTPANTGLAIKRNGSSFTASWKIRTKEMKVQKLRYRTYNWKAKKWNGWITKALGVKATSYTFTLPNTATISSVQVQTQALRKNTNKDTYRVSAWTSSSAVFGFTIPAKPTVTAANDSSNKTTFTWSVAVNAANSQWYRRCLYRTKCDANPNSNTGWSAWTAATSYTYTYTDNVSNQCRAFQIMSQGPRGYSAVATSRHWLTAPPVATWATKNPVSLTELAGYYRMTYNVNIVGSIYSVDSITPQYYIGTPTSSMNVPGGASWNDGTAFNYADGKTAYAMAVTSSDVIDYDECLWARVKTTHDSIDSVSAPYRVLTGALKAPATTITMGTPTPTGFTCDVGIDDVNSAVPGVYQEVYLEKHSATGLENYILIGTVPNGSASKTITSTEDLTGESGYSIHVRNVTADGSSMVSDYDSYTTSMPTAPVLNSVVNTTTSGKVYLSWTNSWTDATGMIIAWTDDPDNWMSNEDPQTYEIEEVAANWFITGLETGQLWYFRVRAVRDVGGNETKSPWSNEVSIDLASAPAVPVLNLSEEAITEDGMVTAYWSYVTTDGTGQIAGSIVEATYSGGVWTYGRSVGSTTTAQHIDIYAKDWGWTNGSTVYLALQTRSGSGGQSEYSTPVELHIAETPTVTITTTSLSASETMTEHFLGDGVTDTFVCANSATATPTVLVEGVAATVSSYSGSSVTLTAAPDDGDEVVITYTTTDNNILDALPLTATVTTTNSATLSVAIERTVAYRMDRPDGTVTDGAIGETVYVETREAEASNSISINASDLLGKLGRLDDGAFYDLVATVESSYGQSVETRVSFKVHWSHQAWEPTVTFVTDTTNYIARITPVAGADYVSGDTCDIYRLSVDQPELVYSGANFGTEYVDPYPAFGEFSGYKVVTVTENQDYITEDNEFAEYDTTQDENTTYTQLDPQTLVIDFDGDRIELPYNITLSNAWSKDFQRTSYLGGHVAGDHNKTVLMDLNAGSVFVRGLDGVDDVKMRALSRYAGICHVRTPDGSSFAADVQVTEGQAYNTRVITYTLNIQKVDPVGYDGMTYAEWSELNQ